VAEGASQGVLTLATLQDLSQARVRWGEAADGFLSLFGAKLILRGIGDPRTLEAVSLLAGDHDVAVLSTNSLRGRLRSRVTSSGETVRRERRIRPDEVASPPTGTAIAIIGAEVGRIGLTPFVSRH
jgi:type IV secretory pathway TraG/TraD family ATPase VirD4